MNLAKRRQTYRPPQLQGTNILGTPQIIQLDQSYPCEGIMIIVNATISGTTLTFPTSPATPAALDAITGLIANVQLQVSDSNGPRTVVNYSGTGLMELNETMGTNLDPASLAFVSASSVAANQNIRLVYYVPLVPPVVGEDLRTRHLLPFHLYQVPPTLQITFATAANLGTGGVISALSTQIVLERRAFPVGGQAAVEAQIAAKGGYIKWDLIESAYNIPVGSTAQQIVPIIIPGEYGNLLFRHYLGGAAMTRSFVDGSSTGTFGTEPMFTLDSAGLIYQQSTWNSLRILNDMSRNRNANSQTSSPDLGAGVVTAGNSFVNGSTANMDFFGDVTGLGSVHELGSVLDCNSVSARNQKMNLTLPSVANVATNGSVILYGGYRYIGDISPFQTFN